MDIISHTLTGTAVGTVVASFSNKKAQHPLLVVLVASFGGVLPDFDAISLWSKFDAVFGELFLLVNSGKQIYFGKLWYSHHGALHSVMLAILLPLIFLSLRYVVTNKSSLSFVGWTHCFSNKKLLILAFSMGFMFHLLEDMPTPHCVWGGVRFFFPSSNYVGGWGKIWWWNNYDLFLMILSVIVMNSILLIVKSIFKVDVKKIVVLVFLVGGLFSVYQINTRGFDFNYINHTPKYAEYELKSKKIQREILGEKVYKIMEALDNSIGLKF